MVGICRKTIKFEEREKSVAWSDQEPEKSSADNIIEKAGSQNPFGDTSSLNLNVDIEDEDPVMQVMLKSIQDPDLVPIYKGLPDLGSVFVMNCCFPRQLMLFFRIYRSVHQYSYVSTVGMGVVTLKDIQNRVGRDNIS